MLVFLSVQTLSLQDLNLALFSAKHLYSIIDLPVQLQSANSLQCMQYLLEIEETCASLIAPMMHDGEVPQIKLVAVLYSII